MILLSDLPNDILESIFVDLFNSERYEDIRSLARASKLLSEAFNEVIHNQCKKDYDRLFWLYNNRNSKNILTDAVSQNRLDIVEEFYTEKKGIFQRIAIDSVLYGRLNILKWLCNKTKNIDDMGGLGVHINIAAKNGHIEVVKYLYETFKDCRHKWTIDEAAEGGHLEIVKWLHENGSQGCSQNAMDMAAKNGHIDVVEWLYKIRTAILICSRFAMNYAVINGDLNIVKYLNEIGYNNETDGIISALNHGHLKIAEYLSSHREINWNHIISSICNIARNGYIDIIKWLYDKYEDKEQYIYAAIAGFAINGNLEMIKWLDEKWIGSYPPFSADVVDWAATYGHLDVVKWLYEKWLSYRMNRIPCTVKAICCASENGHLEVIKYLYEKQLPNSPDAFSCAVQNGHLDCVKWLYNTIGGKCTKTDIDAIIMNNHIDVAKFLFSCHLYDYSPEISIVCAAQRGHMDIIIWFYENTRNHVKWSSEILPIAIQRAAMGGHLELIQWLYSRIENVLYPCRVMEYAAPNNHLNIIKWLNETGYDSDADDIEKLIEIASERGYAEIVRFFRKIKEKSFRK